ncbi:MAG TPA: hypothetical protein VI336_00470 [Candidatus Saccharimonadales bacterium]|nr:hypothetical protein [Candidatus Saccharimonadales bacterium]
MKQIVIIGAKDHGEKNNTRLIADQLVSRLGPNADIKSIFWEDLLFDINAKSQTVSDKTSGFSLVQADLVIAFNWYQNDSKRIFRDVAYTLGLYLDRRGVEFWNREMVKQRSTTKLSATMLLALEGFDIPASLFSLDAKNLLGHTHKYPLIVKSVSASRGRDNHLVKDHEDLKKLLAGADTINRFVIQEYIPNSGDLRIICFGGEPKIVIRRQRIDDSTHLNNTSRGARADLLLPESLGDKLTKDCKTICELMGRDIAGIDLIGVNDGLSRQVYLEVNAIPQLTTGAFVDEKFNALATALQDYLKR